MADLLGDAALEDSEVVANSRMNRGRRLAQYSRELGVDVEAFLSWRARARGRAAWLDLCCGEAQALRQAAARFGEKGLNVDIVGVDLVDMFAPGRPPAEAGPRLELVVASLHRWHPPGTFDLVTCVHGLHYIGDKLGLLARAAGWLVEDGLLLAHLDPGDLRLDGGQAAARWVPHLLRQAGMEMERRIVRCAGARAVTLPVQYLGADDRSGPNATGQPSVTAHYRLRVDGGVG